MRIVLVIIVSTMLGAAYAWIRTENSSTDYQLLLSQRKELLDEITLLKQVDTLPQVYKSWSQIKDYISLYQDLSLTPLSNNSGEALPLKTSGWTGLLSGNAEQLFAASRHIQKMVPVYFDRFTLDAGTDKPIAKLTLYVLGNEE